MLVPSLSWPGETVVGLALHGVFGASLSFGPCTPSQSGLLHIQGAEPFWRCPPQDGKGWNLTGMPGPSEEEKRKSWGTDMKAEGQQPGCLLSRPFRGCLGRPGWWFLHRVLGRGAVGPQCTSRWGAAPPCTRLTCFRFLSAGR